MKNFLILMMGVSLALTVEVLAKEQTRFSQGHTETRVDSWELENNRALPLCQAFEKYLNLHPNAFMNKEFEAHKHIKEVKIPKFTEVSEETFLTVYRQFHTDYKSKGRYYKPESFDETVESHRHYNTKYYTYTADINHDGSKEKVLLVDTYWRGTFYQSIDKTPKTIPIDIPFYPSYLVTKESLLDKSLVGGVPVVQGIPFFYLGRFYLFQGRLYSSSIYEPTIFKTDSTYNPLHMNKVCDFRPLRNQ